MARQHIGRRGAFAQVVQHTGPAHGQRCLQARSHVQHHHHVDAGIDFGVVFGTLGHAPQALQLGQQHAQSTALAQHLEHARGLRLHQPTRDFLPHALGHEVIDLALGDHLLHQTHGLRGNAEVGKPRCKARHAQDAHRVFAESLGDMAQHLGLQIGHAAIRIKNGCIARPVCVCSYGIDSQIAARQVFFQRHIRAGIYRKALIAAPALALGARQGVLLVRLRVQKHRKVAPHGGKALLQHLFGRSAHHQPVAVVHGQAQ